ncbi:MAG: EAL domain-containing protein [Actinomycetota bacterium]|nr:EAL domain-containing protein [Actinomycetota bacterium]
MSSRLNLYITAVLLAGGFALFTDARSIRVPVMTPHRAAIVGVLAGALVIGELLPITLRRGEKGQPYSLSGSAAMALVVMGPLWLVVLAQVSAGLIDDLRSRRPPAKIGFNVSLYAIGITASRAVYTALTGQSLIGFSPHFTQSSIIPTLIAAFAYLVISVAIVAFVSALADERPMFSYFPSYLRGELPTTMTLLAVSPIVIAALDFSLYTLPLTLLPVLAVSRALAAANRELEAMHDSLTGLPSRTLLLERVEKALRERGEQVVGLLFIDLDHFKEVNDAMGHPVGDELLRQIGQRLAGLVSTTDFAARLGGDEFAVLCEELDDPAGAIDLAHRIASELAGPVTLRGVSLHIEASIGVALVPQHADSVDVLLQRADVALYQAKGIGPGSVVVYDPSDDDNSIERLTLMEQLRSGMERELVLYYQPQCRLSDGAIVGVEALVRWQHPTLGLLSPARFLVAAENTGLMLPLTLQVLHQALEQWCRWHEDGLNLTVSVNVSARNLHAEFLAEVKHLLLQSEMPANCLLLEITESSAVRDVTSATEVIHELRQLGIGISIDDFGTGHSSLAHIKELSPTEVKIDQSFVRAAANSPRDEALLRAAVDLGRSLGMQVVAEGVETPDVLRIVANVGCDLVQGYLVLPPAPADELAAWSRQPQTWSRILYPQPAAKAELQEAIR